MLFQVSKLYSHLGLINLEPVKNINMFISQITFNHHVINEIKLFKEWVS